MGNYFLNSDEEWFKEIEQEQIRKRRRQGYENGKSLPEGAKIKYAKTA